MSTSMTTRRTRTSLRQGPPDRTPRSGVLIFLSALILCATATQVTAESSQTGTLNELLARDSAPALIEHTRVLVQGGRMDLLGAELATLRHGRDLQSGSRKFLSTFRSDDRGARDYANATALGRWLGAVRLAFEREDPSARLQAELFAQLSSTLQSAVAAEYREHYPVIDREGVMDGIARGRITLNAALELLAYGDVTSSDVTIPIGQAITTLYRTAPD